ncbi:MAG: cytochrome c3 family protein [Chitinophagales bacterium]
MSPTPVQRWLLLCAGFILLLFPVGVGAQTPNVRSDVERAAGKCALCHAQALPAWQKLPHGGSGRGADGQPETTKPLSCSSCHTSGLLRGNPLAPEKSAAVCGKCHLQKAERSPLSLDASDWDRSSHSKLGTGCLTCHRLHRPNSGPLLKGAADDLCRGCHAPGGKFLHRGPTGDKGQANCTSCHDPHGGKLGGVFAAKVGGEAWQLRKAYTHKPVAEGKCGDCHDVHQTVMGTRGSGTVSGEVADDEEDESPAAGPGAAGPNRSLLAKPPTTICYLCHADKKDSFLKSKHTAAGERIDPPVDNACAACHLPHGSDYAHLTTYQGSRLCLTCHPEKTPHHFLVSAQVSQRKLECVQCHNPHGTQYPAMLVLDRQQLCGKCHKK